MARGRGARPRSRSRSSWAQGAARAAWRAARRMFENSSLPREMRVSPWESSSQRAFANSLAGTVLHTPNSTVTHACVDAPRLLLLGLGLRRVRGLVCRYRHVADVGASLYCPYSRLVAVATAYSLFLACLLVLPWARWPCVAACHALGPFERAGGVCHRCLWGTVGAGAQFWVWWTGLRHVRPLESRVGEGGRGI